MLRVTGLLLFVFVLCASSAARAADKKNPIEKLAGDAAVAYRNGDYARATELLERAYKLQPVSALLYNLAKSYEKLGETEKASELYARYAASEDADPKLRSKAEQRVGALGVLREQPRREAPPKRTEPPPQPDKPVVVAPPPVVIAPPPVDPEQEQRKKLERARTRDRGIALGLGILGLGAVGAGIGLSVNALSLHDQFTASQIELEKRSLREDGKTRALIADVLYAVGVAAIGVGAYFVYRGFRPLRPEKVTVSFAPWIAPGAAGLTAGGRF